MASKLKSNLSYANVMATIAVFLALAGVAGAASALLPKNSVSSKTIKNGQVKVVDLHNGAVTAKKLATDAVTGAAVKDDSLTGADIDESSLKGLSPYATIPSGATVTGSWNYYDIPSPAAQVELVEAFPAPAPVALTDANVNFGNEPGGITNDKDPACGGDSSTPTAPAGKVCIYIDHGSSSPNTLVGNALRLLPTSPTSRYGFEISSGEIGNNGVAGGTWAYTAP
jgi:hypothetical protein